MKTGTTSWSRGVRCICAGVGLAATVFATQAIAADVLKLETGVAAHDGDAPDNLEPGKVLAADAAGIVVKCGSGAVRLTEHGFGSLPAPGSYL